MSTPAPTDNSSQVIRRLVVDGENALCLMPTGGGKSLCFQVPALVRRLRCQAPTLPVADCLLSNASCWTA